MRAQVSDARLILSTLVMGMKTLLFSLGNYGNTNLPRPGVAALVRPLLLLRLHQQKRSLMRSFQQRFSQGQWQPLLADEANKQIADQT